MTDLLFVPPLKNAAPSEPAVSGNIPGDIPGDIIAGSVDDLDPPDATESNSVGAVPAFGAVALATGDAIAATDTAATDTAAIAATDTAAVDTVFFYGQSATGPLTLYQVNLTEGSLSTVTEPVDLYQTLLSGLFTAEPGGLAGLGEASSGPPSQTFTIIRGSDDKNFLIGTAADNALLAFGSGDLILTGQGDNLAFGGAGNDTLVGEAGNNGLFGGDGSDAIEGGAGDDLLVGGPGSDILYGGAGANTLIGGTEADVFRLNSPGAYGPLVGDATVLPPEADVPEADIIVDFSAAEGDVLDFSLIAAQSQFAEGNLLPFLSFVQVGADTQVQITTTLGQVSTEAILLNVLADTITPDSLSFTPPTGLPQLK